MHFNLAIFARLPSSIGRSAEQTAEAPRHVSAVVVQHALPHWLRGDVVFRGDAFGDGPVIQDLVAPQKI